MTHVDDLAAIQNEYGLEVKWLSQWHCRIENVLDIWPTAKKFFDLETKARGTYPDLKRFVLKRFEMKLRKIAALLIVSVTMFPILVLVALCLVLTLPLRAVAAFISWAEDELQRTDA